MYFSILKSCMTLITSITPNTNKGLYLCDTYCYTYMSSKLWLDEKYICDVKNKSLYFTNLSCYDLLLNKSDNYVKPPWIEKNCLKKNLNCYISCNPYTSLCI